MLREGWLTKVAAKRALVVDDEKLIVKGIRFSLEQDDMQVDCAYDGEEALELARANRYDIILLDIMLPGADGFDIMEYIRPMKIPVIFITARHDVHDKVKGLKLGAEDYLVKPFDVLELVARVEVVLRRYHKTDQILSAGDVTVDLEALTVTKAGKPVILTNKEYGLLVLFMQNKNVALFKETLYEKVWKDEYIADSRTLELHVQRLRRKMGWEKNLVAVYKVGYRLEI